MRGFEFERQGKGKLNAYLWSMTFEEGGDHRVLETGDKDRESTGTAS